MPPRFHHCFACYIKRRMSLHLKIGVKLVEISSSGLLVRQINKDMTTPSLPVLLPGQYSEGNQWIIGYPPEVVTCVVRGSPLSEAVKRVTFLSAQFFNLPGGPYVATLHNAPIYSKELRTFNQLKTSIRVGFIGSIRMLY